VLTCAPLAAQTTQTQTSSDRAAVAGGTVTLVGCLQREADYRRAQDAGRGGVARTGVGLGNEYVLIQTEGAGGPGALDANKNADCKSSTAFAGTAYELTGTRERELAPLVGRRIEITGEIKNADDTRRPGGFDPPVVSTDLRLQEVNIQSFREVTTTAQASTASPAPTTAEPEVSGTTGQTVQPRTEPAATTTQNELPRTASPLALYGLVGLLSLGGALGLRFARK
jgi:hypothetical protein